MGIIRGGLVFFVGVLLLLSLTVGNILFTLSLSSNYQNINSGIVSILQNSKTYGYYSLFISLILIVIMFLLIEEKKKMFSNVGLLMVISSLPLLFLNWVVSIFSFADVLFSGSNSVFWVVFIMGIILATVGIGLNFWKFHEVKEEEAPEKEVVKENKKQVKSKKKVDKG